MSQERLTIERHELNRWLPVAVTVVAGLMLYFLLAPATPAVLDVLTPAVTP